jgi:hypothetical protein
MGIIKPNDKRTKSHIGVYCRPKTIHRLLEFHNLFGGILGGDGRWSGRGDNVASSNIDANEL